MAINKAMKAALKALSYSDPDIKKTYKMVREVEKVTSIRIIKDKHCSIRNITVENQGYNVPCRIITNTENIQSKGVVLFFHGGGWVNGDINSYENVCIEMARQLCRTIVAVDYRRAPEYKFPTAPSDCYAVALQLFSGKLLPEFSPDDIILFGDSAGGNLAAAVSLMGRDKGTFVAKRQVLLYPAAGSDHSPNSQFESIRENGFDYLLTSKKIASYVELYINSKEDLKNPYCVPLAETNLQNQPQTLIITAQYCPLRDEGEEYGRRLLDAGNKVTVYRMPDTLHGYFSLPIKYKSVRKTYHIIKAFLGDNNTKEVRSANWIRLDNAAKIFPPTMSKNDPKVFRLSCTLKEEVDPKILQAALEYTVDQFPFYSSILKKGLFWYYFEYSRQEPVVHPEDKEPCSAIYFKDKKTLLFDVTYYKTKINFEIFHALSDGEGATVFFKTLVTQYVQRCHKDQISESAYAEYDASVTQKKDDSFKSNYNNGSLPRKSKQEKAYHLSGEKLTKPSLGIIDGKMSVKALLNQSHSHNCTLTAFLLSLFIKSIGDQMSVMEKERPVVIVLPVDLRQFFPSKSARNFFAVTNIKYDFSKNGSTIEEIIPCVIQSMKDEISKEKVAEIMLGYSAVEKFMPARIVPTAIKDPSLKFVNHITDLGITAAFSNIGKISLPPEFAPFIDSFSLSSSTPRIQACMCSYMDNFIISFTSPFAATDIQRSFFRELSSMGINVEITSNLGSDSNVIL